MKKSKTRDGIMGNSRFKSIKFFFFALGICFIGNLTKAQTLGSLHTNSYIHQQEEFVIEKGVDLKEGLERLEKYANVVFLYRSDVVKGKEISTKMRLPDNVSKALEKLLQDQDLIFKYINPKTYGIYAPEEMAEKSEEVPLMQQVSGTVSDANSGETLPGVNILVKGTTIGTSTDAQGSFEVEVPSLEDTLVVSYVGYRMEEVPIDGETEIHIQLTPETIMTDEVVVVGYGTQERSDVTGSVSSISSEDFNQGANTSVEQLIQGRAAGVQISQTSGAPGGGMSIQIRGIGSINAGTQPLYVVDGVPIDNSNMLAPGEGNIAQLSNNQNARNPMNTLNPNDIESIEILKDASATAIYGSRASNGVVLITTKQGVAGGVQVDFSSEVGTQQIARKIDLLSTSEYIDVMNGLASDRGEDAVFTQDEISNIGAGTDWQDQIYRSAVTYENNISLSGGGESTNYFLSLNQYKQNGIVKQSGIKRYSFRSNLTSNITDKIEAGFKLNTSLIDNNNTPSGVNLNEQAGPIYTSLLFDPTLPVYDENGNFYRSPNLTINNPMATVEGITSMNRVKRFLGNGFIRYNMLDELQMNLNIGFDTQSDEADIYNSTHTIHGEANNGIAGISELGRSNITVESTVQYERDINEDNNIRLLGGVVYEDFVSESHSAEIRNFPTDDIKTYNLALGDISSASLNSNRERYKLSSYLGRINYRLLDRYLVTTSMRVDGSSRFGANNKFGFFPSLALAWNMAEEEFIPSDFDELKFRASWGVTGNQEIGNYNTQLSFVSGADAVFGGERVGSLVPTRVANPDLKWERSEELNFGLDASVYQDRFSATIDYFIKRTSDMLIQQPLPSSSGFTARLVNLEDATIENQGLELGFNSINVSSQNFSWSTDISFSAIRNTVKNLGGIENILLGGLQDVGSYAIIREGDPIASYYGHKITGVFQEGDDIASSAQPNAEPGYPIIQDTDGDGNIDDGDKVLLGKPHPDFEIGIQNRLSYKQFQFEFFIDSKQGYELLNMNMIETLYPHNFRRNRFAEPYLNRWTPENTETKWPSGTFPSEYGGGKVNSYTVEDASFIRLKTVTLRYNIPQNLIRRASVSLTGQNLVTLTDYSGYTPEANAFGRSIGRVDFNTYPLARTFMLGVNLGF